MTVLALASPSSRASALYVLTLAAVLAGTALCAFALRRPRWDVLAAALAGTGAGAWLLSNGAGEGPLLVLVTTGNGLTAADLLAVPAGCLVGLLVLRRLRGRA